jgi:hypothetical protein
MPKKKDEDSNTNPQKTDEITERADGNLARPDDGTIRRPDGGTIGRPDGPIIRRPVD